MNSCLVVAGEKSGEEHAMSFIPELKKYSPDMHFFGVGGDALAANEMELLYHLKDFSSIGFSEVIKKYPFYKKAFKKILDEVEKRNCKYAILIDFQTFNLKLAQKLKERGIKVFYYVAPQAWVWKEKRVEILKNCLDTLFCILPFEKKWFTERGVKSIISVQHPIMYRHKKYLPITKQNKTDKSWKIVLLPGSRNFEVEELLPRFVETIKILRQHFKIEVSLVKVDHINDSLYLLASELNPKIYDSSDLEDALLDADLSLASSGTVTLSLGLFAVPTLVCYRTSLFNLFMFNNLIAYKGFISLTNIIHQKEMFPEFIQDEVDPHILSNYMLKWMNHPDKYNLRLNELLKTQNLVIGEDVSVARYIHQKMELGK
jgi:lipid-A-disaccharide synthase